MNSECQYVEYVGNHRGRPGTMLPTEQESFEADKHHEDLAF